MYKKIILSFLLIISTVTHGMEHERYNTDVFNLITTALCENHKWNGAGIGTDFKSLALVNKSFAAHYTNENVQKNIVKQLSKQLNLTDDQSAQKLYFTHIYKTIKNIYHILEWGTTGPLTPELLPDAWYCNISLEMLKTPLRAAIKKEKTADVQLLIERGATIDTPSRQSVLTFIAKQREYLFQDIPNVYLSIAELLLSNKANPDHRKSIFHPTALMKAIRNYDREYAYFLLKHGANPYLLKVTKATSEKVLSAEDIKNINTYPLNTLLPEYNDKEPWFENAFGIEKKNTCLLAESFMWFTKMVRAMEQESTQEGPAHKKQKLDNTMDLEQ